MFEELTDFSSEIDIDLKQSTFQIDTQPLLKVATSIISKKRTWFQQMLNIFEKLF